MRRQRTRSGSICAISRRRTIRSIIAPSTHRICCSRLYRNKRRIICYHTAPASGLSPSSCPIPGGIAQAGYRCHSFFFGILRLSVLSKDLIPSSKIEMREVVCSGVSRSDWVMVSYSLYCCFWIFSNAVLPFRVK